MNIYAPSARKGGNMETCPACGRQIPSEVYLRDGRIVGCDGCLRAYEVWELPIEFTEGGEEMDELRELLEAKIREILENSEDISIKDVKDAATVLRDLHALTEPETAPAAPGGIVELGSPGGVDG